MTVGGAGASKDLPTGESAEPLAMPSSKSEITPPLAAIGDAEVASPAERSRRVIVTIDGPAGTGKSTVAFLLAERLGLEFLDTGAMYRALTLCALERGLAAADEDAMTALAEETDLRFDFRARPPVLLVNGRSVGERIRAEDVTAAVSVVASHPPVREALVRAQRDIGCEHPRLVTEGRDQGTVVFPDAELKIYLDARPDVRAHRRALQLRAKNLAVDEVEILNAILARDRLDSTRATGRMRRPDDAIVVDTSELSTEEVVTELSRLARQRLREAVLAGGPSDGIAGAAMRSSIDHEGGERV